MQALKHENLGRITVGLGKAFRALFQGAMQYFPLRALAEINKFVAVINVVAVWELYSASQHTKLLAGEFVHESRAILQQYYLYTMC